MHPAISQRYGYIAKVAASSGPLNRVIFELLVKSLRCEHQVGNQIRVWQARIWHETLVVFFFRKPVPGTDHLAYIAAEGPVAHVRAQVGWDFAFVFDGQVRDATPGVERPVRQDAMGWTGFDATRAGSAAVGCEGRVGFQVNAEQDFSQQEIRTEFWVDQTGVFTDPTQTGALRQVAFQDGPCIGIPAVRHRPSHLLLDKCDQCL